MDEFTAPLVDWTTPADLHKRFKIFKQKCNLIFDGPLENQAEDKKTRFMLLWAGDKGLEIYKTAKWSKFLTRARTLVDDSGYGPAIKEETLRDTLVFGLKSDKVRKDAISK
ncbi:unnamed protein product, partial [Porites evermanni]